MLLVPGPQHVLPDVLPRIASLFRAEEARLLFAGDPSRPTRGALRLARVLVRACSPRPTWPPPPWSPERPSRRCPGSGRHPPGGTTCWSRRWSRPAASRGCSSSARPPGAGAALAAGHRDGRALDNARPGQPHPRGEVQAPADRRAVLGRHPRARRRRPGPAVEPGAGGAHRPPAELAALGRPSASSSAALGPTAADRPVAPPASPLPTPDEPRATVELVRSCATTASSASCAAPTPRCTTTASWSATS